MVKGAAARIVLTISVNAPSSGGRRVFLKGVGK